MTTATAISVDREALVALLTEAIAAGEVIDRLAPVAMAHFTDKLNSKIDAVTASLGEACRDEIELTGERRARGVIADFSGELTERLGAAPLPIKLLAVGLLERDENG